jgi:hypothetical protein
MADRIDELVAKRAIALEQPRSEKRYPPSNFSCPPRPKSGQKAASSQSRAIGARFAGKDVSTVDERRWAMQTRIGIMLALVLTGSLLVSGFVPSPASAAVIAKSTFDSDTEGWTAIRVDMAGNALPGTVSFAAGAGNPGGALRHDAPSDSRTSYVSASSSIVTALRSAVGGSVSWDISTINATTDIFFSDVDIIIRAGTNQIRRNVTPPAPPLSPTYVRYSLGVGTGAGWLFFDGANTTTATQAQIDAVVAGAESLTIRTEYWSSFTPDTTFLDNVVVAGPGPAVVLNRGTVAPGDVVELRLVNPPGGAVDLYVVVALPQSLAPSLGCGNSLPLVFVSNGGSALTLSCSSNPPSSFPRYVGGTTISAGTLLSIAWPAEAPPGDYIFAAVVTPPGALADNVLGGGDILAAPTDQLTAP